MIYDIYFANCWIGYGNYDVCSLRIIYNDPNTIYCTTLRSSVYRKGASYSAHREMNQLIRLVINLFQLD